MAAIQSVRFGARRLDVQLLLLLGEIEERRLHLRLACSSIFDFCRRTLRMSEGEASRRMHASRLVCKLPGLIRYIEAGRIHLTTLTMLRDFLTESNLEELVTATEGKTKDQVKELLAALAPRPDVPARIRKLPDIASHALSGSSVAVATRETSLAEAPAGSPSLFTHAASGRSPSSVTSPASPAPSRPRGRIEPLAPARYRLEMTIGATERNKLERVRELMRHRLPTGDLGEIFSAALDLLVTKLEKERLAATSNPRSASKRSPTRPSANAPSAQREAAASSDARAQANAEANANANARAQADAPAQANALAQAEGPRPGRGSVRRSRRAPSAVRRAVFARDGEQCTFRDAGGHRCPARGFLELDHETAFGRGGDATVENIRVLCKPHNRLHAEDTFGAYVASRIQARRRAPAD